MALFVWQRTIVDEHGNVQPGAILQITHEADSSLAAVYKDREGADPWPTGTVTADSFGFARFYAAPGRYRIRSMSPAVDWRDVALGAAQIGTDPDQVPSNQAMAEAIEEAIEEATTYNAGFTGAVDRSIEERLRERVSVADFGALGDGVADDTDAIQKAIDAVSVHTYGGTVFFPRGVYKVTGTLEVAHHYITLEGEGMNAATLQRDFATGYTVDFSRGGATDTIFYGQVLNLTFDTTVAMSSGAHLRLNVARLFRVANCRFSNGWIGIAAISVGDVLIDNCTIVTGTMYPTGGSEAYAYLVFDTDASANNPRNGAYVRHCNFRSRDDDDGHVLFGIVVTSADGIWFDQVHVGNSSSNNVFITPKTGTTQLSGLKFSGCWFDQNGAGRGVSIEGETSAVYGFIWFDDCYFTGGTNGTVALRVAPSSGVVRQVFLSNCLIINYTSSGLQFGNCEDFAVTDCVLRNVASAGGAHGIQVFDTCKNFRLIGNSSGYKTDVSTTSGAGYGIVVAAGADGYIITNNDLRGNTTGGLLDGGGPTKVVDNNLS